MPIATDKLLHQIVSRLRLRHLPLLLALERQRSVSRVAAELNLSQPAVTKALREIEDIFMTPLFTRTRNGLEPTATGAAVLTHARMTMADAEALGRQLAVIEAGKRGDRKDRQQHEVTRKPLASGRAGRGRAAGRKRSGLQAFRGIVFDRARGRGRRRRRRP